MDLTRLSLYTQVIVKEKWQQHRMCMLLISVALAIIALGKQLMGINMTVQLLLIHDCFLCCTCQPICPKRLVGIKRIGVYSLLVSLS